MLALCIVPALSVVLVLVLHFMLYFVMHGRAALCCLVCSVNIRRLGVELELPCCVGGFISLLLPATVVRCMLI